MEKYDLPKHHDQHCNFFLRHENVEVKAPFWMVHRYLLYNIFAIIKRMFPYRPRSIEVPLERVVQIATPVKLK
jgi:hypothetical protein